MWPFSKNEESGSKESGDKVVVDKFSIEEPEYVSRVKSYHLIKIEDAEKLSYHDVGVALAVIQEKEGFDSVDMIECKAPFVFTFIRYHSDDEYRKLLIEREAERKKRFAEAVLPHIKYSEIKTE